MKNELRDQQYKRLQNAYIKAGKPKDASFANIKRILDEKENSDVE